MTGRCDHRAAGRAHGGDDLLGEPRLADPRGPLEDRQAAVWHGRAMRGHERRQLAVAPCERQPRRLGRRPGSEGRVCRTRDASRRTRSGNGAVADRVVQRRGLGERRDTQLTVQRGDGIAILADRRGRLTGLRERGDQQALGGFVERVQGDPAARRLDRCRVVARRGLHPRKALQHPCKVAPVRLRLRELPGVPFVAVSQREARHEVPAVERRRLVERGKARRARLVRGMSVGADPGKRSPEAEDVHIDGGPVQRDNAAIDAQPGPAEAGVQHGERAAEGAPRVGRVRIRPEERRQRIAVGRPRRHRQVGE